jgi:Acetyltransferase (GNAT) family.
MKMRLILPQERDQTISLIWDTFLEFEAPDYSEQGVTTFHDFIFDENIFENIEFFGAFEDEDLRGVIASRNEREHICCFFVPSTYQRQGIGTQLWDYLRDNSNASTITVNSSPFAVPVYHKLGFVDTRTEQLTDGMRYTPMKFTKG